VSDQQPPISRGFRGRRVEPENRDRVPPGQYVARDFPVLSAGPTPHIPLTEWTFSMLVGNTPVGKWAWTEFQDLPQSRVTVDIHCVTKWSKLDTVWEGVTIDALLDAAGLSAPPTAYMMAHCYGGYSTNVPTADLVGGRAMIATRFADAPLAAAHGGPARLLIPHLYFWKSAKWVRGIHLMEKDKPGFWESAGYHNHGDPWKEQRYWND
jgi:DMSO/TMAO reductase YedYZ molybdopterin-dependent catalytic subunit